MKIQNKKANFLVYPILIALVIFFLVYSVSDSITYNLPPYPGTSAIKLASMSDKADEIKLFIREAAKEALEQSYEDAWMKGRSDRIIILNPGSSKLDNFFLGRYNPEVLGKMGENIAYLVKLKYGINIGDIDLVHSESKIIGSIHGRLMIDKCLNIMFEPSADTFEFSSSDAEQFVFKNTFKKVNKYYDEIKDISEGNSNIDANMLASLIAAVYDYRHSFYDYSQVDCRNVNDGLGYYYSKVEKHASELDSAFQKVGSDESMAFDPERFKAAIVYLDLGKLIHPEIGSRDENYHAKDAFQNSYEALKTAVLNSRRSIGSQEQLSSGDQVRWIDVLNALSSIRSIDVSYVRKLAEFTEVVLAYNKLFEEAHPSGKKLPEDISYVSGSHDVVPIDFSFDAKINTYSLNPVFTIEDYPANLYYLKPYLNPIIEECGSLAATKEKILEDREEDLASVQAKDQTSNEGEFTGEPADQEESQSPASYKEGTALYEFMRYKTQGKFDKASKLLKDAGYPGNAYALLYGICSRETECGLSAQCDIPGPSCRGDYGHGHGLFQIDDRYHKDFIASGKWSDPQESSIYAAKLLVSKYSYLKNKGYDNWRYAVSAYNSGEGNVKKCFDSGKDSDCRTTGRDYAEDVLKRAATYYEGTAPAEWVPPPVTVKTTKIVIINPEDVESCISKKVKLINDKFAQDKIPASLTFGSECAETDTSEGVYPFCVENHDDKRLSYRFALTISSKAASAEPNHVLRPEIDYLKVSDIDTSELVNPPRIYKTAQLMDIYGKSAEEVEKQLVEIDFQGKKIRVHKKAAKAFLKVDEDIKKCSDEESRSYSFDDLQTYNWRLIRNGNELSRHSFGIAIDINPKNNPFCPYWAVCKKQNVLITDIPECIVKAFIKNGFVWGGLWTSVKDPMHFEYAGEPDDTYVS